jgi:hypothetical protein
VNLNEFAAEANVYEKGEVDKVALVAYFDLRRNDRKSFEVKDVNSWFATLFLAAPNAHRLREKLRQSPLFTVNGGEIRLHARGIREFDQKYPTLARLVEPSGPKSGSATFVDKTRLDDLKTIASTKFDLTKLIRLCEELNISFAQECFFSTAMLTRAIIDHVPPVFGFKSFAELANNYAGGKSIRDSMQRLDLSCRKIADQHLHLQIRQRESTPSKTQVDFSNDLDVLLAEVIRTLK